MLSIGDAWNPDKVIVLTSSTDTIEKHIRMRNREHEEVENMVRRFRLIDGEFRRLAPLYPNTIVIDRDSKEFHERAGLVDIITLAGLPMFKEIPYARSREDLRARRRRIGHQPQRFRKISRRQRAVAGIQFQHAQVLVGGAVVRVERQRLLERLRAPDRAARAWCRRRRSDRRSARRLGSIAIARCALRDRSLASP